MKRWRIVLAAISFSALDACALSASSVQPSQGPLLDEIGTHFHSARRWFGMVSDLEFQRASDGTLSPRYETLHSPLVIRQDGAGQTLRVGLPSQAAGTHTIALSTDAAVWVRTHEDAILHVPAEVARGVVVYPGAIANGDLIYKLTPTHVDEYVYFRSPPPTFVRRIGFETGPGISRLHEVPGFIEVLDHDATARLRLSAPTARAADGTRRRGTARVEGSTIVLEIDLRGLAAPVLVDPDWSTTGTMTVGHWSESAWRMQDGRVMVVAGCALAGCPTSFAQSGCGQVLADTEIWSAASGTWSAGPPLATARFAYGGAPLPTGDFLVAGGCTTPGCTATTDAAEIYRNARSGWESAGHLSAPRGNAMTAVLAGGDVIVAGGCDQAICSTVTDRYLASQNTWRTAAPLSRPRGYATTTVLGDGRVLVTGGCSDNACTSILGDAEIYDPASDHWSATGSMSDARAGHTATLLGDGSVLIAGGCADVGCMRTLPTTEIWSADASGGTFHAAATMPGARHNHTASVLATGEVLFAGGANGASTSLPTAEVYVPTQSRWVPIDSMQMDRAFHVAVPLQSGSVLLAGGCNPQTCMPWCETYSPENLPQQILTDAGTVADTGADVPIVPDPPAPAADSPHPAGYRNGVTRCATDSVQELACPIASHPLQDGDFQPNLRTYSNSQSGEITDPVTGLIWQSTDDGMTYDQPAAVQHCAAFATAGAPAGQWRLPSVVELMSLVHYGVNNPSIDPAFQGTQSTNYWTTTAVGSGASQTWTVKFDFGEVIPFGATHSAAVRCVRGGANRADAQADGHLRQAGAFIADGLTVRDETTGLEWQRSDDGVRRSWRDALRYCANSNLAGKTGWHLPNVNELRGLVEYGATAGGAVIDQAFTGARPDLYWTASPNDGVPTLSWSVSFNLGIVDGVTITGLAYSRCVRHIPMTGPTTTDCHCRSVPTADPSRGISPRYLLAILGVGIAMAARRRRRSAR